MPTHHTYNLEGLNKSRETLSRQMLAACACTYFDWVRTLGHERARSCDANNVSATWQKQSISFGIYFSRQRLPRTATRFQYLIVNTPPRFQYLIVYTPHKLIGRLALAVTMAGQYGGMFGCTYSTESIGSDTWLSLSLTQAEHYGDIFLINKFHRNIHLRSSTLL